MSSWLSSLPHQIPFRAASSARIVNDSTVEGSFLCTASEALAEGGLTSTLMIFEAMAQIGGTLVFQNTSAPGFLSAIDGASIDGPVLPGDSLDVRVTVEAEFNGLFRLSAVALRDGLEFARAKFYLAGQTDKLTVDG